MISVHCAQNASCSLARCAWALLYVQTKRPVLFSTQNRQVEEGHRLSQHTCGKVEKEGDNGSFGHNKLTLDVTDSALCKAENNART